MIKQNLTYKDGFMYFYNDYSIRLKSSVIKWIAHQTVGG